MVNIGVECKKCGNKEPYRGILVENSIEESAKMLADNYVFQKCSKCGDEFRVQSYNLFEMK